MCPKSLLMASTTSMASNEDTSQRGQGKCKEGHGSRDNKGKGSEVKKLRGTLDKKKHWLENKKCDLALKSTKQSILKTQKHTNLGQLLHANKASIVEVLKLISLATTDCGHFHMWGGCYDMNCMLNHNNITLTSQQNEKINSALLDGLKKLASKKVKQE